MMIGEVLLGWRLSHHRMGVREAAKIIGISPATLSRIENGHAFDGATMAKIVIWLCQEVTS